MPSDLSIYDTEMPRIVAGVYDDCTVEYTKNSEYVLRHKGIQWMKIDSDFVHPKDTFYSQYDLAYGDVLLTGLGFGILAKALAQKESVSSITVIELNAGVISCFLQHNKLDPKITIVEADASTYVTNKKYDCLLPDHYELQGLEWTLADMKDIAKRINHDLYWPWSIEEIFFRKVYPKQEYPIGAQKLIDTYKKEIPAKWEQFIEENLQNTKTLAKLDDKKLLEYLKKHAIHYYDIHVDKNEWVL
jgi:hypothetical protein